MMEIMSLKTQTQLVAKFTQARLKMEFGFPKIFFRVLVLIFHRYKGTIDLYIR